MYVPFRSTNQKISVDYRKAFLACRKHRIDLEILVHHNPEAFFSRISTFLEQIDDVDYINLFLTSVGYVLT